MPGFVLTYENLKAWCTRQSFEFRENTERGELAVLYKLLGADAPLIILPQLSRGMVVFAMEMPFRVPPERYDAVREAVTLLNASAYMGAWVLNSKTGELYFRVTVPALDNEYTDQGLLHAARIVVGTAEHVAERLKAVVDGTAEPASVIVPA